MQNTQWQSLSTRYGFQMTSTEKGFLDSTINEVNRQFLRNVLQELDVDFYMNQKELIIDSAPVYRRKIRRRIEEVNEWENRNALPCERLTICHSGLIYQGNGYTTKPIRVMTEMSCDGHGKRSARVGFQNAKCRNKPKSYLTTFNYHIDPHSSKNFIRNNRKQLTQFAEKLSTITLEEARQMYKEYNVTKI